ncbi:APC family permease [Puia dinghuensis]|uniref:Amino acid transporter n=1 Tax=Puia dinghuensis TaxID=1792502 RepID=A0A8J2UDX2_9BACT|nr:APC family permease [Puia dinghuensis]GGB03027.1 amino acid transporter [Puia dinghuensis]
MRKLRPLQLAAVIFLTVSGGPYGLEPLFSYVGTHGAMLLLLVTPLLWDVPTILTVLELNSLMPVTGGYYQWVKHALGLRWAFFEGWWTWLYTFCDLTIYPVLFVTYAAFFFPEIAHYKIPVCLLIVWTSALLNIIGIVPVGKASLVLSAVVIVPFLLIFGLLFFGSHPVAIPTPALHNPQFSTLSLGLYTVMWNFIGWDNATTYAGEVARPVRSYFTSVCLAFLFTVSIYILATISVNQTGIDTSGFHEGDMPLIGVLLGGRWLGMLVAAGGMAGTLGLYSAVLLSVSRVPKVMADDQLLPTWFCALHRRFGTPYISILVSSAIVSILVVLSFSELVVMDIILYGAALTLEFLALIILRSKEPDRPRPFKIPLGKKGLVLLVIAPILVYSIALAGALMSSDTMQLPLGLGLGMLFSATLAWWVIRWRKPHLATQGPHIK